MFKKKVDLKIEICFFRISFRTYKTNLEKPLESLTTRQMQAIARQHKLKYYKLSRSEVIELLRDIEIKSVPELRSLKIPLLKKYTRKKCHHGKNK